MSNKKEIWKTFTVDGKKPSVAYAISNLGRFGVMTESGKVELRHFKPTAGNYRFNTRQDGKNRAIFLSKEVARAFLKKPSNKHTFVIHKNHDYLNNDIDNLKWATAKEHRAHTSLSPKSVIARQKKAIVNSSHARVLDEKNATQLKKMIWDPKRKLTYKQLAHKFGVSEMQIYRIKTGQFWYHIRVENEPLHAKYKQNLSNIAYQQKKEGKSAPIASGAKKTAAKKRTSTSKRKK